MFKGKRPDVDSVFTPRATTVTEGMYIARTSYESKLLRSVRSNMHTVLFGESGNGKSWLYKEVLDREKIAYVVANCANATATSLRSVICDSLARQNTSTKTGFTEKKQAEVSAGFAKGGVEHTANYTVSNKEILLKSFEQFAKHSPGGKRVIVIENLEAIFDNAQLMKEMADLILLLDDESYGQFNINFLLVGTPNEVLEYFSKTSLQHSVSNRLEEVEKISGFEKAQVKEVCERGFGRLQVSISDIDLQRMSQHVFRITMGIPQRVQEYCRKLAYVIEDNSWIYTDSLLEHADLEWLLQGLRSSYSVIEKHLNSRGTNICRKNQVLYCIGELKSHQTESSAIVETITNLFPKSVPKSGHLGIAKILDDLCGGAHPILLKNTSTKKYTVKDPRFLMCIRLIMAYDVGAERLRVKNFQL